MHKVRRPHSECGNLLPPGFGKACFALTDDGCNIKKGCREYVTVLMNRGCVQFAARQQAAANQGASKLAHSKHAFGVRSLAFIWGKIMMSCNVCDISWLRSCNLDLRLVGVLAHKVVVDRHP